MGKHEEALELFNKAIEKDSKVASYHKTKEDTLLKLG